MGTSKSNTVRTPQCKHCLGNNSETGNYWREMTWLRSTRTHQRLSLIFVCFFKLYAAGASQQLKTTVLESKICVAGMGYG